MKNLSNWTSQKWIKRRIIFISLFFLFTLLALLKRSYVLHIADNQKVDRLLSAQHETTFSVNPKRGTIFDRYGNVLAMDVEVASIAIHPEMIEDENQVRDVLSKSLKINKKKINSKIKSNKKFLWVKRRIPFEIGEKIRSEKIRGVSVLSEYRRFYPNRDVAGQLLGAVGYDAKALAGIELSLDSFIKSDSIKVTASRDAKGRLYTPYLKEGVYHDVHLTLDLDLQYAAEKYLHEGAKKYDVDKGFVLVLEPKSGEILAMANYPSFNPNAYWDYPQSHWKNQSISLSFEPGSTFKPFIVASGLQSGKINIDDTFDCENGRYKVGRHTIKDHDPYKDLNASDIIKFSSNIGVTKIGEKIGYETFYKTITDLNFYKKVGLRLPGEERGFLNHYKKWKTIDASNIAFGQGVAVNGLQVAQAYTAIANQGILSPAYLVEKIRSSKGDVISKNNLVNRKQVFYPQVANQIKSMLEEVVNEEGTGTFAAIQGYRIGGKTGTAQKVNAQSGGYDKDNFISSFIGMAPIEDPQYIVYVVYDSPKGRIHTGGYVAAPIFRKIVNHALYQHNIRPIREHFANQSI